MKISSITTILALMIFLACTPKRKMIETPIPVMSPLDSVAFCMAGFYDSIDQAEADSQYYPITLAMIPIRKNDPVYEWLYVEQAIATTPEEPYRVRVYRLESVSASRFISRVFTLEEEWKYRQAWLYPDRLRTLDTAGMEEREGCAVFLERKGPFEYEGATISSTCPSSLRGASYAESVVSFNTDELRSWDRGYDKFGRQVWGARKGPYIFKKRPADPFFSE